MANTSYIGNAANVLKTLPDKSINCIVTSPPYYKKRDYRTGKWVGGDAACTHIANRSKTKVQDNSQSTCKHCHAVRVDEQIGMEDTPRQFIERLLQVFKECHRVLNDDGTLWVNMGDTFNGSGKGRNANGEGYFNVFQSTNFGSVDGLLSKTDVQGYKPKDLLGIPWMLAFALRDELGFYLRNEIIWDKPNPMPESVNDRCTVSHESIFLFSKKRKYFYDAVAIMTEAKDIDRELRGMGTHKHTDGAPGQPKHSIVQPRQSRTRASGLVRDRMLDYDSKESELRPYDNRGTAQHEAEVPVSGKANKRTVWEVTSQPYAGIHYAVFPEKLAEPMVLAGTSEQGCCAMCGKQYIRLTEKKLFPTAKASFNTQPDQRDLVADENDAGSNRVKDGHKPGWVYDFKTVGWKKPCSCPTDEIKPAVVLDPFGGSGTVAIVANKGGRDSILIDLNEKYVLEDQQLRLHQEIGIFNQNTIIKC